MLQKLLLQLVISMHFPSFIGSISIFYMTIKLLCGIHFCKDMPPTFISNLFFNYRSKFILSALFSKIFCYHLFRDLKPENILLDFRVSMFCFC